MQASLDSLFKFHVDVVFFIFQTLRNGRIDVAHIIIVISIFLSINSNDRKMIIVNQAKSKNIMPKQINSSSINYYFRPLPHVPM